VISTVVYVTRVVKEGREQIRLVVVARGLGLGISNSAADDGENGMPACLALLPL